MATVAVALGGAECLLVAGLLSGARLWLVLGLHAAVTTVAGLWLVGGRRRHTPFGPVLAIATGGFGPIGPIGVLAAMVVVGRHGRDTADLETWHRTLFPPEADLSKNEGWKPVGERARDRARPRDITPFQEILQFGSIAQRQAAIAVIAQKFDPAFAPVLRAAPADENPVVRVQAASAIARLEHQLFDRTLELEASIAETPDDPQAVLALARHNDAQAFAGLFDPDREARCRREAADLYGRYLAACPDDADVELALARLLLRSGRAADALPRFRHLIAGGHPTAALWEMECLFALGRYEDVRASARRWQARAERPRLSEVEATISFWADPGAAA